VIVPQFSGNTYTTDMDEVKARYCTLAGNMFNNWTAIDRQTVLSDDDGSLTGWAKTISVSEDPFFTTPRDGIECQTDTSTKEGGTAKTSPYDYVSTVVYPDCAKLGGTGCAGLNWDQDCTNPNCFGVKLYRLYQTGPERPMPAVTTNIPQFIRMAGSSIYQRQTMTVNHGLYYVDLTPSTTTQFNFGNLLNVFMGGETYDFFYVFSTPDTQQTYKMFVGKNLAKMPDVKPIRVNIKTAPLVITPDTQRSALSPPPAYDPKDGILTVTLNLKAFKPDYDSARIDHCVPKTFCAWNGSKCVGKPDVYPPLTLAELTQAERNATCAYAGKDIDCPTGGCVGFSVTLPEGFVANNQTAANGNALLKPLAKCFPNDDIWNNKELKPAPSTLAGACTPAKARLKCDFCDKTPACPPVQ
ncbi:MAG: hypothetical protein L0Y50_12800, partial [Beijerinckiaceae bacterium]|nr:hypothetical protein [Beijerinckiaceae bacterium]